MSKIACSVKVTKLAPTGRKPVRYCATSVAGRTFYHPTDLAATDKVHREAAYTEHMSRISAVDGRIQWQRGTRDQRAKRIPCWLTSADRRAMATVYATARRLTKETGVEHHVDHEWPLLGHYVSGLHVPGNLRVITAVENLRKGNQSSAYQSKP